jgi:hypothetical protein
MGPQSINQQFGKSYMNNKQKNKNGNGHIFKISCAIAVLFVGFTISVAAQQTQKDLPTMGKVTGTGCPGTYYAFARMTNGTGAVWLTPPSGTTSGIFKDVSGFPSPYASATQVIQRSDGTQWCATSTNGVSFPASSSTSYSMTVYVTSKTPPPTSGQPLVLQVTWQ